VSWVSPGIAYQTSAPDNPVTGQLWVDSDETGDSLDPYIIRRKTITATAGQTVFTTDVVFTDGYEQIYYNGVLLVRTTDYTTNGGTNTVTLLQGASAGDTVEIISSTPINLVNTITSSGGTITAPNASAIPLKIVGVASQSADLFEVLNSSNAELFAIRPSGRVKSEIISTESDSLNLRLHANVNNGSNGVSVILWGKDVGTWGGDVHYLADSRGASGAHRFWNWDGTNFLQRAVIDKDGNFGVGTTPSGTKTSIQSNDGLTTLSVINTGGGTSTAGALYVQGGSFVNVDSTRYIAHFVDSSATSRMLITNGGNVGIGTSSPNKKLTVAGDYNFSTERSYYLGQPSANVLSTGTNCYTIKFNRPAIYFKGIVFDVYMNGGKDWGGYGSMTYHGKMMVVFQSNTTPTLRMLNEYSSSALNGNGFFTFNTYTSTYDNDYLYLTVKYNCSISASDGHRPLMHIVTHDPQSYGDTSATGSNSHINSIYAV
jgi:hypothetical protein